MNPLGKRNVIVIGDKNVQLNEFKKLVFSYKSILEEKQVKKINVLLELNIHTISLIYAALLLGSHINITKNPEETHNIYNDFIDESQIIKKVDKNFKMKFYKEDSEIALSFNNEEISYEELKGVIRRIRRNYGRSEIVYSNDLERMSSLCLGLIIPIYLEHLLIFSDNIQKIFKNYKPTIFIGEKRKIKNLYTLIFNFTYKDKIKEILYGFFKDWDNSVLNIFINRWILFKNFKALKMIVIEEKNDLNGLWLDFESLGIEIFSKKIVLEKKIEIEY